MRKQKKDASILKVFMPLMGGQTIQTRAARAIPVLLKLAMDRQTITYGELAKRLSMSNPRHVVPVISLAAEVIDEYFERQAPDICALVVSAAKKMPGDGYVLSCEDNILPISKQAYLDLSLDEKRQVIKVLQERVYAFAGWEDLLPLARNFCQYSI